MGELFYKGKTTPLIYCNDKSKIMYKDKPYQDGPDLSKYLRYWDFTKSLTDLVTGEVIDVTNATYTDGVGISIDTASNWFRFNTGDTLDDNFTLEVEFGNCVNGNLSNNHGRFLMINRDPISGLIWRYDSGYKWHWFDINRWESDYDGGEDQTSGSLFDKSTLKLKLPERHKYTSNMFAEIYKDNVSISKYYIYTGNDTRFKTLQIGSSSGQSFFGDVVVKGIRTYNENA